MSKTTETKLKMNSASDAETSMSWSVIIARIGIVILLVAGAAFAFHLHNAQQDKKYAAAQNVSDKAIVALEARSGAAARGLGTKQFQSTYSDKQLTDQFKAVEVATTGAHHVDTRITQGQTVYFIYVYDRLKVPYYVRTSTVKVDGAWKLSSITGSSDESKLYVE